jgi:hypothetical protein
MSYYVPMDSVSVDVKLVEHVTSETVKVRIVADVAVPDESFDVRGKVLEALGKVNEAEWRFVDASRSRERSGSELATVTVQARIPDKALNGLSDRLKAASYTGLQLRHDSTDYRPPRKQVEEAILKMRMQVYARAVAEVTEINTLLKDGADGSWRVGGIRFIDPDLDDARAGSRGRIMASATLESVGSPKGGGAPQGSAMDLTTRLEMTATITMQRKVYNTL